MAIKLGTTGIGAVYKGSTQIAAIYKGSTLVYQLKQLIEFAGYRLSNRCNNTFRLIKGLNNTGTDTYYSILYKLVKPKTWANKTWSGLSSINALRIWTDGRNIYYSNGSSNYVLDVATSTWSTKTWSGLSQVYGHQIWSDGENIYHTNNNSTHVLDVATSTWVAKGWGGFSPASATLIWTDGRNIYYSNGSSNYVLDVENSRWNAKTWSGLTSISPNYLWTNGTDIFYSEGNTSSAGSQYVLNKSTSTWVAKTWSWPSGKTLKGPDGSAIWTDGTNLYLSSINGQYKTYGLSSSSWYTTTWQKSDTTPIDIYADGMWSALPD